MSQGLSARLGLYYRLADALCVLLTLYLSYTLRTTIDAGMPAPEANWIIPLALYLIAVLIWQVVFEVFNVYALTRRTLGTLTVRRIAEAHVIATMTFWGVLYVVYRDFSRLQSLYFVGVLFVALVGYRFVWDVLRSARGIPIRWKRNVLIIGVGDYAQEIARVITDYATLGLQFVGFIPHTDEQSDAQSDQILGSLDQLNEIIEKYSIHEVVVCDKSYKRADLLKIHDTLVNSAVNLRLAPDYSELAYFHVAVEDFAGIPLLSLRYDMLTSGQRALKRVFDLVGASLLLLLALPFLIAIAIAIRLDSPGPAFFRQLRVGERGRLFTMYKFRTMVWDAENKIAYSTHYKQADDPRVTRVGRWLRRTSIDEIPQLINVLRGEMSLVGPRPELPQVVALYSPWQRKRFEVPQGLTGWWQINGRSDLPMYEHVDYDVFYIRNYSVWLDLQILARTPLAVLRGRGAF